jgi:hypothetical protein
MNELLQKGESIVQPLTEIATILQNVQATLGSQEAILAALRAYANDPSSQPVVAAIVKTAGGDPATVSKFLEEHDSELVLLLGTVGQLAGKRMSWPVGGDKAIEAGVVSIQLAAEASATLSVDSAGDTVTIGVDGTVSSNANVSWPISTISGKAAFAANAAISFGNSFEHATTDKALPAIARDLTAMLLPYGAAKLAAGQTIHLGSSGSVAISAELSWGRTFVVTRTVTVSELGVDAVPIATNAAPSAGIRFKSELKGDFDITIVRAAAPGMVNVTLKRNRGSSNEASIGVGVDLDIKGLDVAAKAALAQITTPLAPLVAILEADAAKYSDLRKLFDERLGAAVDAELAKATVLDEIQQWLTVIGKDANLKAQLKTVVMNAVDQTAGPLIDNLQNDINPVIDVVKSLIERYQAALTRINNAIKRAAEVKIGIALARTRQSSSSSSVTLDLDIDPALDEYRRLVHGDFTAAIDRATSGGGGVKINSGLWHKEGKLSLATSLKISVFGHNVGLGSLLQQSFDIDVSSSGDVTIGVTGSIEAYQAGWRSLRSIEFIADTQVLATIGKAKQLIDPKVTSSVTVESSVEWKPNAAELGDWQSAMIAFGVLAQPTTMVADVAPSPSVELLTSAVMPLTEEQLGVLAMQDVDTAGGQFVEQLMEFYLTAFPYQKRDPETNMPFLLWPKVRKFGDQVNPSFATSLEFENGVQVGKEQLPLVHNVLQLVRTFESMVAVLKTVNDHPLTNLTPDAAMLEIRDHQRELLDAVGKVLRLSTDRDRVGKAFFKTLWLLAGGEGVIDPFVVIERESDAKRFVYV